MKPAWKYLLAYLLTDEAYAVAITHFNQKGPSPTRHWHLLGAGLTLWSTWQISTVASILIGSQLGLNWSLSFALPLTFIGLVVPGIRDRATLAAAVSAGVIGLLFSGLPYKLGLIVAAVVGISMGVWMEK